MSLKNPSNHTAVLPDEEQTKSIRILKFFLSKDPRIELFYVLYGLMALILCAGMFYRQLVQNNQYEQLGEQQSLRRVLEPGPRGDIYDRHGNLLVGTRPKRNAVVYLDELRDTFREKYIKKVKKARKAGEDVNRHLLRNEARVDVIEKYLKKLNSLLGTDAEVDAEDISNHFRRRLLLPFPLIEDISPSQYAKIIEQLPQNSPIQVYTDSARYYPYHSAAAHVLGFVSPSKELPKGNIPGEDLTTFSLKGQSGRAGLERHMEDTLAGKTGGKVWRVDPAGYQYKLLQKKNAQRGNSIKTTLDIDLQRSAEDALGRYRGAVVALDVKTGEVLALASKPNYNLNALSPRMSQKTYDRIESQGAWLNRAIQGRYPPGSTFKIMTIIAAMRSQNLDPERVINCGAVYQIGNREFPEHGRTALGKINLPQAIQKSSNVYMYRIAEETGIDAMYQEAHRFGFGKKTGIELPAENAGTLPSPEWKEKRLYEPWRPGDTANMSIGQGYLLSTPLQMATFTASFAKREIRTHPTLIKNENSFEEHNSEKSPSKPIGLSDKQYNAIVKGMNMAASNGGTARRIQIPGIPIAAKTGSAEFTSQSKELTVAWTIAFAPVDDPQIALAVMVEGEEPDDNYSGGKTATPIARDVLKTYFNKYPLRDLPPESQSPTQLQASGTYHERGSHP